jgi:hypothetical protein
MNKKLLNLAIVSSLSIFAAQSLEAKGGYGNNSSAHGNGKYGQKENNSSAHEDDNYGQNENMQRNERNVTEIVNQYEKFILNDEVKADLTFMYEEEKLAHDVYTILGEKYSDTDVFLKIADAETRHMEAVKSLLDKYSLPVPVDNGLGNFNNVELQSLADELISKGEVSREKALKVGQVIEITDFSDIGDRLREDTPDDVKDIFQRLYLGSVNHLSAFSKELFGNKNENHSKMDDDKRAERKHGVYLDNGNPTMEMPTQVVTREFKAGWELVSIPVVTDVEISTLLPKDVDGAIIYTYDNELRKWDFTRVNFDAENGEMTQGTELNLKPLQGFWIKSPKDFKLSTYIPNEVTTSEEIATPPSPTAE